MGTGSTVEGTARERKEMRRFKIDKHLTSNGIDFVVFEGSRDDYGYKWTAIQFFPTYEECEAFVNNELEGTNESKDQ